MWTITVDEYNELSIFKRMVYRLYRNPAVMFGLGPVHLFLNQYRFNRKGAGRKERLNTYVTNFALIGVFTVLCFTLGWKPVLFVEAPILYLSGVMGIWLFYVQHQFEHTYFEKSDKWDYVSAALKGSSFYKLPRILQWITGNIGFHHIHHLSPRVPNYHLQQVHESNPYLQQVSSITLRSSFRSLHFRLWDEGGGKFVGFKKQGTIDDIESKVMAWFNLSPLIRILLDKYKIKR